MIVIANIFYDCACNFMYKSYTKSSLAVVCLESLRKLAHVKYRYFFQKQRLKISLEKKYYFNNFAHNID